MHQYPHLWPQNKPSFAKHLNVYSNKFDLVNIKSNGNDFGNKIVLLNNQL